jgi:YVTN family beta-propeller protein
MLTVTVGSSVTIPYHLVAAQSSAMQNSVGNCNTINADVAHQVSRPSVPTAGVGVQNGPLAVAVDNKTNTAYVANSASNTVSVIGSTGRILANISVGIFPISAVFQPATNLVYVANRDSNSISVIDTLTNHVVNTIVLGTARPYLYSLNQRFPSNYPSSIVLDGKVLYVFHDYNLTAIDTDYGTRTDITFPTSKTFGRFLPLGPMAVNTHTDKVYILGTAGQMAVIPVGGLIPYPAAYPSMISIINVSTDDVQSVAVNPRTNMVYVSSGDGVIVVKGTDHFFPSLRGTDMPICKISIPEGFYGSTIESMVVNPNNNTVYAIAWDGKVYVIDGTSNTLVKGVGLSVYPTPTPSLPVYRRQLAFNSNTNMLYVPNEASDTVSIIDGKTNSGLVGVTFEVTPKESGIIFCNGHKVDNIVFYDDNIKLSCIAKAKHWPFTYWSIIPPIWFDSWSGNLPSPDSVKDYNIITFTPTQLKFGTLVANFNVLSDAYITTILAIAIPAAGALILKYSPLRDWFSRLRRNKN